MPRTKRTAERAADEAMEAVKNVAKATEKEIGKAAEKIVAKALEPTEEKKKKTEKTEKKTAVKISYVLEYGGMQYQQDAVIKKIKENWTKVQKRKIKDIKTMVVYLQPENHCAYYVINDESAPDFRVEL